MAFTRKNKGYSIVEMIVYLAIFTSLSLAVINSFIVISSALGRTRSSRDLLESGSIALERMSREIRQAKSIDTSNSVLGTSTNPLLQLNSTDSSGSALVVKFTAPAAANGALNLYEGASSASTLFGNLLGANISVTSLIFRRISTAQGEAVKIEMTLKDSRGKMNRSENFYDTIILRGEY